ncbi:MAG: putative DNA-binding domain-containing protein [Ramlibacter sp.]
MSAMLLEQQEGLLEALWAPHHEDAIAALGGGRHINLKTACWQRGLMAYRSGGLELARRSLAAVYPVVGQLLGDDNFNALASALWRSDPPCRGDVARWGEALAALIESLPDLSAAEPYLADVARGEWLLHEAATAVDVVGDIESLRMLAERPPESMTMLLTSGIGCIASPFPIASIISAHLDGAPSIEQAGRCLREGVQEAAVVWRQGLKPRLRAAVVGEPAFLAALRKQCSLAHSLGAAPDLNFNQWLVAAVRSGLVLGVVAL